MFQTFHPPKKNPQMTMEWVIMGGSFAGNEVFDLDM
jgi:hypothetical protein